MKVRVSPNPHLIAYSKADAAKAAGDISTKTIERAIKSGRLQSRRIGRRVVIMRDDLTQWIEDGGRTE